MPPELRVQSAAEVVAEHHARLVADGGLPKAWDELQVALSALAGQFSDEIGASFDWTYRGADPVRAAVFRAAADLGLLLGDRRSHIPQVQLVG